MISAQTLRVCRKGKPGAYFFRIMLWQKPTLLRTLSQQPAYYERASHLEQLGVTRLDLLALRQHSGGIRFEQFQRR